MEKSNKKVLEGTEKCPVSAGFPLLILFAASFLIHTLLNIAIKEAPTVVIDEGLYTNIARSLAWKGELAFRGQPVDYPYLLYPVLLVPLYWINRLIGGDIYRYIQVFGTLLITSSVFPVALFAYDFTKEKKKTLLAAVIVSVMPDMVMGGYSMSECVIWPLSLWMVFFCYRFYTRHELKYGLLTALAAGLLFSAKPGALTAGTVMLLIYFITALRNKDFSLKNAAFSLVLLFAVIAAVYGIYLFLFHESSSLIGLYSKQTSAWTSKTILVALEAFFLTVFIWIFACGGICALIPIVSINQYKSDKKKFISAFLCGILFLLMGTSIFVVPFDWNDSLGVLPLHLRYSAMYIPVMFVLSQEEFSDPSGKALKKNLATALIVFILLCLFPGARAGFVIGGTTEFDSMALSAFTTTLNLDGVLSGWILTALVVLASLIFLIFVYKNGVTDKLQMACAVCFLFFTLYNAVCSHLNTYIYIDPTISSDAMEVSKMIEGSDCLGITQRDYENIYSYWLDGRLNEPMQQVTIDQMFVTMRETGGLYSPFIPLDQLPNVNDHETPDTDKFVLGMTIGEHLELNESVKVTETGHGHFTFAEIDPSVPWVDTMMWGIDGNDLNAGESCFIQIFNPNRDNDGMLQITFSASGFGSLQIEGKTVILSGEEKTYTLALPYKDLIEIRAEGANARIFSYSTSAK